MNDQPIAGPIDIALLDQATGDVQLHHQPIDDPIVSRCSIHLGAGAEKGKIVRFTQKTLDKANQSLTRRKQMRDSKYSKLYLPNEISENIEGYHTPCYRSLTALPTLSDAPQSSSVALRSCSEGTSMTNSTTGIYKQICIFCLKKDKKHNCIKQKLIKCETKEFDSNLKKMADVLNDHEMQGRIADNDLIAKEVYYHAMCRVTYQKKADTVIQQQSKHLSLWKKCRLAHQDAFDSISRFIEISIIQNKEVHFVKDVHKQYIAFLRELAPENGEEYGEFTVQHLQEKLLKTFVGKIKIDYKNQKRGNVVFSAELDLEIAVRQVFNNNDTVQKLKDVAYLLRREIFNAPKQLLPDEVTVDDINAGEVSVPENVKSFFKFLIRGPDSRVVESEKTERRIDSISQDAVYMVSKGLMKPRKHLQLAMSLKSITGSRKVVEMMNRLGHCVSYSFTEELETELTYSSMKQNYLTPNGLEKVPYLGTSVAWDNYDAFVETIDGKGTLHDTVGICFQNIADVEYQANPNQPRNDSRFRKRRSIEPLALEMEPYRKKPRMNNSPLLPITDERREQPNAYKFDALDTLWMMSLEFNLSETPMWIGWNSKVLSDDLPKQRICYLPQINESPTSLQVVMETMKQSQRIAQECNQPYMIVTYDLAIAKLAMTIQAEECPRFDNLFVILGGFHILMAFFKSVGKYLDESGGPHILSECGILAQGSLKGFITGTHFNRCKRIHTLLAAAMELLHFQRFYHNAYDISDELKEEILNLQRKPSKFNFDQLSDDLKSLINDYNIFCQQTQAGIHGKTAQYWYGYIRLVYIYHQFSRSIHMGDYDMFLYSLREMASIFFIFNQPNYARWLVRQEDNMLRIDETHPGLREIFVQGALSIRRTNKNFSRTAVDMTLEQTINSNSANKLSGISAFTNSISARQRWALSHYMRMQVVNNMMDNLGLSNKEETAPELRSSNKRKQHQQLTACLDLISQFQDPFAEDMPPTLLVNISTGRAASEKTAHFLSNVFEEGKELRKNFITECVERPRRFEEPIKRITIQSFATEAKPAISTSKDQKLKKIVMERDLMGRLLFLSLEKQIDLQEVLTYPLTPIPLSLAHLDGTMLSTDKSVLMRTLETKVQSSDPKDIECTIVDGMFFLHTMGDLPPTFGGVARSVLTKLCKLPGRDIHVVFDLHLSPSIKDSERTKRAEFQNDTSYSITGPEMKRPVNFIRALRSNNFKEELTHFLVKSWQQDSFASILGNKRLWATLNDRCICFKNNSESMAFFEDETLICSHEEADSRMIFHIANLHRSITNVVVRSNDTDVLVILLANKCKLPEKIHIWMEVGFQTKNTLRYIDIDLLADKIGLSMCLALAGFHSFTGCDYTSAFLGKGKARPYKILENSQPFQEAFKTFGHSESVDETISKTIEHFVCQIYGFPKLRSVNQVRLEMLAKAYRPKRGSEFGNIKGVDGSSMPPNRTCLDKKIARCNYVSAIWNNASEPNPSLGNPETNGWMIDDNNHLIANWFEGPRTPLTLENIVLPETTNDKDDMQMHEEDDDDEEDDESESDSDD